MFQARFSEGAGNERGWLQTGAAMADIGLSSPGDCGAIVHELYRSHHRALIGYLRSRLPSLWEAEEVAQDAYLRMLSLGGAPCIERLQAYLFRIAANLATDRLRRQGVRERHEVPESSEQPEPAATADAIAAAVPGPECAAIGSEALRLLSGAIGSMSPRRRQAFVRAVFDGRSTRQVAAEMGVSIKAVEKHLAAARAHCRQALFADGVELEGVSARLRKANAF